MRNRGMMNGDGEFVFVQTYEGVERNGYGDGGNDETCNEVIIISDDDSADDDDGDDGGDGDDEEDSQRRNQSDSTTKSVKSCCLVCRCFTKVPWYLDIYIQRLSQSASESARFHYETG